MVSNGIPFLIPEQRGFTCFVFYSQLYGSTSECEGRSELAGLR